MATNNIYDTANQLERDLRELPAYVELKEAYEEIKANPEANELFEKFRTTSQALQTKQMAGEQPTEEDITQLQELSTEVSQNDLINVLMEKEQMVSNTINDINNIITKPLNEIYQ